MGRVEDGGCERRERRRQVLRGFGAREEELAGLLDYTATVYGALDGAVACLPLSDEPHLEAWQRYAADAASRGAFAALQDRFVQLRFPIRTGISQSEEYRRATRRGDFSASASFAPGLILEDANRLELQIHQSVAGKIPVLIPSTRRDFVTLVQAFSERNEPVPVSDSMGACLVTGLINWDRVGALHREGAPAQNALHQDRFIILSRGPYSATQADEAGVTPAEWIERSIAIRREHECVHYLTYRLSGLIRSNVLDELVADFAGLIAGTGAYTKDLALRCLGLHRYPEIPAASRLRVYRGSLSDSQLAIVAALACRAAAHLEVCARQWGDRLRDVGALANVVVSLVSVSVEELADGMVPLPRSSES